MHVYAAHKQVRVLAWHVTESTNFAVAVACPYATHVIMTAIARLTASVRAAVMARADLSAPAKRALAAQLTFMVGPAAQAQDATVDAFLRGLGAALVRCASVTLNRQCLVAQLQCADQTLNLRLAILAVPQAAMRR